MNRSLTPYEQKSVPVPERDVFLEEYTLRAGDTLSGLAHSFYGDWSLWPLIAEHNHIEDVRRLEPGTRLVIPVRVPEQGRYESV